MGGCGQQAWCAAGVSWNCAWRPAQTADMMRAQNCGSYNEAIVSAHAWNQALPATIEAVVFAAEDARATAVSIHRRFLQRFGRTLGQTPVLQWTLGAETPFRDASWDPEGDS